MKRLRRILPAGVKKIARMLALRISGTTRLPVVKVDRAALGVLGRSGPLLCGIIGLGKMGQTHVEVLRGRSHFKIVGLTSGNPQKRIFADELGCRWFESADKMIHSGDVEVVVIATPHWRHAELAGAALGLGLHVVCEKPLAVTVAQADAVRQAAELSKGLLTVVFQSRYEPAYQYTKAMLDSGELGPILRAEMVETSLRSDAYYKSSPWRGTWQGEGGGVLVNQAPHVLDRYAWLCGMPAEVAGFCATALHHIEVEDTISAVFQHAGGPQGQIHVSTNECPSVSRVVIVCDRGRITIDNGTVQVERLEQSIRTRSATATGLFESIPTRSQKLGGASHAWSNELLGLFYDQFALAVAGKQPLLVSGAAAAQSVELANAIMLSSARRCALKLPVNRNDVDAFFAGKLAPDQTRGTENR
jgi:predicted dehydrogenase